MESMGQTTAELMMPLFKLAREFFLPSVFGLSKHRPAIGLRWRTLCILGMALGLSLSAWADGWHAAVLAVPKDKYLKANRERISGLVKKLKPTEGTVRSERPTKSNTKPDKTLDPTQKVGKLLANLDKEELGRARLVCDEMLRLLEYMNSDNIFPREFPLFDMKSIPQMRLDAQDVLRELSPAAIELVKQRILDFFMNRKPRARGVRRGEVLRVSPLYFPELVSLMMHFHKLGYINDKKLSEFAKRVGRVGSGEAREFEDELNQHLKKTRDIRVVYYAKALRDKDFNKEDRDLFLTEMKNLMFEAKRQAKPIPRLVLEICFKAPASMKSTLAELIVDTQPMGLKMSDYEELKSAIKSITKKMEVQKHIDQVNKEKLLVHKALKDNDVAVLVLFLPKAEGKTRDQILGRLSNASFQISYKKNQSHLKGLSALLDTNHDKYARQLLESAYQVAPISSSLRDLSSAQGSYRNLIETALQERVAQADQTRKESYMKWAGTVADDSDETRDARFAAAQFMLRVDPPKAVPSTIRVMAVVSINRKVLLATELKKITGQDFGPKPGMSLLETIGSVEKWQQWDQARQKN